MQGGASEVAPIKKTSMIRVQDAPLNYYLRIKTVHIIEHRQIHHSKNKKMASKISFKEK